MIWGSTRQTAAMTRGLQQETEVLASYAELMRVNVLPVGLVILPEAPHLGAIPDGRVYDPTESPPFGLVEVKCTTKSNASQVAHLKDDSGNVILRQSHRYYWQVKGQLAVTGLEWCDFVTDTQANSYILRIWQDNDFIIEMTQKLDLLYMNVYLKLH
uniref:YqaJ viral recombinase domain-containing protein n=1 Tax=Nothobranchius furzeri TaxID=105023 RepID=A0A1A8U7H2_NOTFU